MWNRKSVSCLFLSSCSLEPLAVHVTACYILIERLFKSFVLFSFCLFHGLVIQDSPSVNTYLFFYYTSLSSTLFSQLFEYILMVLLSHLLPFMLGAPHKRWGKYPASCIPYYIRVWSIYSIVNSPTSDFSYSITMSTKYQNREIKFKPREHSPFS
jgi:hypothetical protein